MSELVAILLRTGTRNKSALEIARDITANGRLREIAALQHVEELSKIKGVGLAKAATLLAAIELGKRLSMGAMGEKVTITGPQDGARVLMSRLRYEQHEEFCVILLNTKNIVLRVEKIAEGSLNASVVHPREVFAPAFMLHAAAILVGHNHPSGDPSPSQEDINLTKALATTGSIMGIPLMDHVIIGDGVYYSFKENGLI